MEHRDPTTGGRERIVAYWLLALCVMVYAMVLIGGITRLTYSGLSIVEWKPLTGWLPPLTSEQWEEAFAAYQRFPEYREVNLGMTLEEFRGIFLVEYGHRLWGRLIGLAFLVPFVVFFMRGWIGPKLLPKLLVAFVLGGAQGAVGWYMVKSGLVDVPDVSAYRLTAHLGLALIILGYLLWIALGLLFPPAGAAGPVRPTPLRRYAWAVLAVVFVTALSGGLVAGNDAGYAYNTFPTMNGEWVPAELFILDPLAVNFFENITTVQFDHRLLALVTLTLVLGGWVWSWRRALAQRTRLAAGLLGMLVLVQAGLGIFTLLLVVPLPLALMHQAGAVALFSAAVWTAFEMRRDPAAK